MKNQKKIKKINAEMMEKKNVFKKLLKISYEIYNFRTLSGLKQEELAKNIKTTQKMVSRIENSEINFGINSMIKIVDALNIPFRFGDFSQNINDGLAEQDHEVCYRNFKYKINKNYNLDYIAYDFACEEDDSFVGKVENKIESI